MSDASVGLLDGLRVAAALAFVLALVVAAQWFVRRGLKVGTGRSLEVEERVPLAKGVQLVVVNASGRRLLLGVAEKHVSLVTDLDPADEPEPADEPSGPRATVARWGARGAAPAAPAAPPDIASWLVEKWRARKADR